MERPKALPNAPSVLAGHPSPLLLSPFYPHSPPQLQPQVLFLFFGAKFSHEARALACGLDQGVGILDSQSKVLGDPGILVP